MPFSSLDWLCCGREQTELERDLLEKSGDANDEGTNSMMSDFITEQEKTVWMMKAWLGETV